MGVAGVVLMGVDEARLSTTGHAVPIRYSVAGVVVVEGVILTEAQEVVMVLEVELTMVVGVEEVGAKAEAEEAARMMVGVVRRPIISLREKKTLSARLVCVVCLG
jgi:hypothetical protein